MARLLVLDDEARIRTLIRRVVERMGHAVEEAPNGADGLELLRDGAFDLIVTDLNMPGMNGVELIARVREIEPALPILLVTGSSSRQDETQAAKSVGATAVLPKPFGVSDLMHAVDTLLDVGSPAASSGT